MHFLNDESHKGLFGAMLIRYEGIFFGCQVKCIKKESRLVTLPALFYCHLCGTSPA